MPLHSSKPLFVDEKTPPQLHQAYEEELNRISFFVCNERLYSSQILCLISLARDRLLESDLALSLECVQQTENQLNNAVIFKRTQRNNFTYRSNDNPKNSGF